MLTIDEARKRVARGAALLDVQAPGWAERIDPGLLVLESCTECVLGQLFGNYISGYQYLVWPRHTGAAHYGFDIMMSESKGLRRDAYRRLVDAWVEAIADRIVQPARDLVEVSG